MPWTRVELGVAMDVDGDTTVGVVVPIDGDMDADGEAKDPECTRRAGGTSGPELRAAILVRDGRGIILKSIVKKSRDDQLLVCRRVQKHMQWKNHLEGFRNVPICCTPYCYTLASKATCTSSSV